MENQRIDISKEIKNDIKEVNDYLYSFAEKIIDNLVEEKIKLIYEQFRKKKEQLKKDFGHSTKKIGENVTIIFDDLYKKYKTVTLKKLFTEQELVNFKNCYNEVLPENPQPKLLFNDPSFKIRDKALGLLFDEIEIDLYYIRYNEFSNQIQFDEIGNIYFKKLTKAILDSNLKYKAIKRNGATENLIAFELTTI